MHVLGRRDDDGAAAAFGDFLARDGSDGASVALDVERPHAALVVGKRGAGKTHTLGVVAEAVAGAPGVTPVVVDPMGDLRGLAATGAHVVDRPRVRADAIPPAAWPALLGLDEAGPAGSLVWRAASEATTLPAMRAAVAESSAEPPARRAAANHLALADSWGVFDADGLDARELDRACGTVLDCSAFADAPTNALCLAVGHALYEGRQRDELARLPWLLVDEAHVPFGGVAASALKTILTRGRTPGVSLVAATQRPGALPSVVVSQADLLVAHRLTAGDDLAALAAANATYAAGRLADRLPGSRGCALVVDDAAESVHRVRVRERRTPDGGEGPRASDVRADAVDARGLAVAYGGDASGSENAE